MGRAPLILGVILALTLTACSDRDTPTTPSSTTSSLSGPVAVTIFSPGPIVPISAGQQFSARVIFSDGSSPSGASQSVVWSVSGSGCSGAGCGTIDATGQYTAPATVPNPATVMVRATSALDSRWFNAVPIVIVAVAGESFSFSVSPSEVPFGNQMLNTTSTPKTVMLTNTGSEPQPVFGRVNGSPGSWQDFTLTNDCPSNIAVGASCTFTITFRPSATGNRIAYLIFDGVFDEEGIVNLMGVGTN